MGAHDAQYIAEFQSPPTHVLFRVVWDISEYCGNFEDLDEEVEVPVAEVDINDEDAVYEWISGEYPCIVESVTQIKEGGE